MRSIIARLARVGFVFAMLTPAALAQVWDDGHKPGPRPSNETIWDDGLKPVPKPSNESIWDDGLKPVPKPSNEGIWDDGQKPVRKLKPSHTP